jgi:uncharacterized protein (DUF2235 family)
LVELTRQVQRHQSVKSRLAARERVNSLEVRSVSRRLVVCCDGTWDVPDQVHGAVATPTNVAKLALGVETGGESDRELFYEPGVGTTADERVLGGAFGYGLSRNVRSGYRYLARNYRPGDQLFLFGLSRGA